VRKRERGQQKGPAEDLRTNGEDSQNKSNLKVLIAHFSNGRGPTKDLGGREKKKRNERPFDHEYKSLKNAFFYSVLVAKEKRQVLST